MTKEECAVLIKKKIAQCEIDRVKDNERTANNKGYVSNDSWYAGVKCGLLAALSLVGMIDKPNKL